MHDAVAADDQEVDLCLQVALVARPWQDRLVEPRWPGRFDRRECRPQLRRLGLVPGDRRVAIGQHSMTRQASGCSSTS